MTRLRPAFAIASVVLALPSLGLAMQSDDQSDSKASSYKSAVKDLKRVDGPMPLYLRKKEVLLEIPEDKLGKLFLVQAALETGVDGGFLSAGMPVGGNAVDVFKWQRHDDQLWLMRPHVGFRWDEKDPYAFGAERTFPEAILGSFRIEQTDPERKLLLVNISQMFYGDLFHLQEMIMGGLSGPYQIDREKTGVEKVRGFPENDTVEMNMHFYSSRGAEPNPLAALLGLSSDNTLEDDRSAPLKVVYTMWYRRDDGYKPRLEDPRIGYFDESFFSLDKYQDKDRTERFINRFNLIKKDASAKLSEPVKPITWTLDPSIPEAYRPAIKEGVLRWNKAFEDAGFKNAVAVQDAPKNDPDYNHADGRYNVIRMVVSPQSPFEAISLFRTDPLSGEILNASITLDGNIIRDFMQEHFRNRESVLKPQERNALQVLMRDRGIGLYGDDTTPENWIPSSEGLSDTRVQMPWMVIHTLSGQFAYDPAGNLSQYTDADGRANTYQYDSAGNVSGETWYPTAEDAENAEDPTNAISYARDSAGRITSEADANSADTYAYDSAGNLASATESLPDGPTV